MDDDSCIAQNDSDKASYFFYARVFADKKLTLDFMAHLLGSSLSLAGDTSIMNAPLSAIFVASIAVACLGQSKLSSSFAPTLPHRNLVTGSALSESGPIVINGRKGAIIQGLKITSKTGDCVRLVKSVNITIRNSEIGPCGGNAVAITGGDEIRIVDSYIHPETPSPGCCDQNDGIFALETSNLLIQGNVIAYGETNIEVLGGNRVTVIGNFLLNPRGPFPRGQNFQCWRARGSLPWCKNVIVENNYVISSLDSSKYLYPEGTEDSINFGYTNHAVAQNNYITGGHSKSGCGLIADSTVIDAEFRNNKLLDTGQCGIGIADGTNHVVDGNKVLNRTPVFGGGNQGIYVWQVHKEKGHCGPVSVSNNIALAYKPDGTKSGFWKGQGCDPMTSTNNVFGQDAFKLLTPVDQVFPPPLIPPQPKDCVVTSPYSTQTGWHPCHDAN
jgi:polygalacturonase